MTQDQLQLRQPHAGDTNPKHSHRFHGWKRELKTIIDEHNQWKGQGDRRRIASNRTREERETVLFRSFRELREHCGFKIDNPRNFKPKHVEALAKYWEAKGLSAATIQGRLSILRTFALWINKLGMIGESKNYVTNKERVTRHYAADHDKSWSGNGIDAGAIIKRVSLVDEYVAMQLEIIATFGLRRKEGVMFDPFLADHGLFLLVDHGTKGNRPRCVMIDSPRKREMVERAKAFVLKTKGHRSHIGEPGKTLEQNLKRYSNLLSSLGITKATLGVTGHGLRAQFACDRLEERGITAAVRSRNGTRETALSPEDQELALKKTSEELGHSRTSIMAAYCGQFGNAVKAKAKTDDGDI